MPKIRTKPNDKTSENALKTGIRPISSIAAAGYPKRRRKGRLSPEERDILSSVENLGTQLSFLHTQYDFITDPALIDGCIYEIKSVQMKYKYYIQLCRERGLMKEAFL